MRGSKLSRPKKQVKGHYGKDHVTSTYDGLAKKAVKDDVYNPVAGLPPL